MNSSTWILSGQKIEIWSTQVICEFNPMHDTCPRSWGLQDILLCYTIFILVTQKEEPNPGSLICVDNYITKDPFFFIHSTAVHCVEIMRKRVGVFELENFRIHIFSLDTAEMFQDGLRWSKVVWDGPEMVSFVQNITTESRMVQDVLDA